MSGQSFANGSGIVFPTFFTPAAVSSFWHAVHRLVSTRLKRLLNYSPSMLCCVCLHCFTHRWLHPGSDRLCSPYIRVQLEPHHDSGIRRSRCRRQSFWSTLRYPMSIPVYQLFKSDWSFRLTRTWRPEPTDRGCFSIFFIAISKTLACVFFEKHFAKRSYRAGLCRNGLMCHASSSSSPPPPQFLRHANRFSWFVIRALRFYLYMYMKIIKELNN